MEITSGLLLSNLRKKRGLMRKRTLVSVICYFLIVMSVSVAAAGDPNIQNPTSEKQQVIFEVVHTPMDYFTHDTQIDERMIAEMILAEEGPATIVESEPIQEEEQQAEIPTMEETTETPTEVQPETSQPPAPAPSYPVYSVDGQVLDENIQRYFYEKLSAAGIGWWFPYALCTAYQESRFNLYAENVNGLDKGLLQYRITYWNWKRDIFDPYAQIDIYVSQNANRLINMGLDIPSTISRHMMSDWGPYNQDYVDHVMYWVSTLVQIK